jgi:drug/metabolite transporter (DMT)-like permease
MSDAHANRRGILAMCGAMVLFICNDTFVKLTTADLPVSQILVVRGTFTVAILCILVVVTGAWSRIGVVRQPIVLFRAGLEGLSSLLFVSALAVMPIATLTAVLMASPLVITLLSIFLFGEDVRWRRWAAIIVGFSGALVIVRPSPSGIDLWASVGLLCAFVVGFRDIVTRKLDPATPSMVVALASAVAVILVGLALIPVGPWAALEARHVAYLAIAGLFLAGGSWLATVAFRGVEVSVVSPFRYTIVVWSLMLGFFVFGEVPDTQAMIGTALIVGAGLYTLHREAARRGAAP